MGDHFRKPFCCACLLCHKQAKLVCYDLTMSTAFQHNNNKRYIPRITCLRNHRSPPPPQRSSLHACSTADAGSWSSGTSLLGEEEEDDRHRDDAFDPLLLHRFEPSLLSPSQTAAAAVGPPAAGASGRLPVFVELHSSSSCTAAQDNSTGGGSGPSVGYQVSKTRSGFRGGKGGEKPAH